MIHFQGQQQPEKFSSPHFIRSLEEAVLTRSIPIIYVVHLEGVSVVEDATGVGRVVH